MPILILVPGGFLMIFLDKQHHAMIILNIIFFYTFPVRLVGNLPQKMFFCLSLGLLWNLVALFLPFPSWTELCEVYSKVKTTKATF